ncbi:MAG: D-glycero-alpha-D-manno-heptose-1,7-bisphosphate 7-phosphatase [Limisphaerales bacterium]
MSSQVNRTVFLDRDGVLIEEVHLLTRPEQIRVLPGVAEALQKLKTAGFYLIVVSNQTVISRGLATESEVKAINSHMEELLENASLLDAIYICPHHPNATLASYRSNCHCRKPHPGLLLRAAEEHAINLTRSFMIGDRMTDIIAGARAGCRTILVHTGNHLAPPIETAEPLDETICPDHVCADLKAAAQWILEVQ